MSSLALGSLLTVGDQPDARLSLTMAEHYMAEHHMAEAGASNAGGQIAPNQLKLS